MWKFNDQVKDFFKEVRDDTFPFKKVRVIVIISFLVGLYGSIGPFIRKLFQLKALYSKIDDIVLNTYLPFLMLFQTMVIYYFADVNFDKNKHEEAAKRRI